MGNARDPERRCQTCRYECKCVSAHRLFPAAVTGASRAANRGKRRGLVLVRRRVAGVKRVHTSLSAQY
jgi:hypothetical protein